MSHNFSHDTFLSPLTWRYSSEAMRKIWSLDYQRRLWRRLWLALAEAQHLAGLVTQEQVADLRLHAEEIDLERSFAIEAIIHHDLMAEVHAFAEQCPSGGGIIHLGATSMDIEDNAEVLRIRDALDLLLTSLRDILLQLAERIIHEADHVCMAYTHLQPAEPTTIGYRLASYAQDLLSDYTLLRHLRTQLKGKGFKGAVGTSASYHELLRDTQLTPQQMEAHIMNAIGLPAYDITTQTYPRRQDWEILNGLAGFGMTAYKIAFDLRLLQSPPFGEWSEPFAEKQVGSSAMPFKRNPIHAENIDSLARYLAAMPRVAWDNSAHSLLERTLDDSGNRRIVIPEAFLIGDELARRLSKIIGGLQINTQQVQHNLRTYGVFAATERLLMTLVRRGANRQHLHEVIREHSLTAWAAIKAGKPNPLQALLAAEPQITHLITEVEILALLDASNYVGDAPSAARCFGLYLQQTLT